MSNQTLFKIERRWLALSVCLVGLVACGGGGGSSDSGNGTTPPPPPPPPPAAGSLALTAGPLSVAPGGRAGLSWTTTNATSCEASGGWSGARPTSGSEQTPALSSTTTFTLTCNSPSGQMSRSATIEVTAAPAPTIALTANPTTVAGGAGTNLSWSSTNATSCLASGGWSGARGTSGSADSGPLAATTTFALACSGPGGQATQSVVVNVASSGPALYSVAGTVTGATGNVTLRLNGGNDLIVPNNGAFVFPTALANGAAYSVSVLTAPIGQSCTVSNPSGTIAGTSVVNVIVACTTNPTLYSIGGSVSGLSGTLVLQLNGADDRTIATNGIYSFLRPLAAGTSYSVTIRTQPSGQACTVSNATGVVPATPVININVACSVRYTVGGLVSGLGSGTLALRLNGNNELTVTTDGPFTFATGLNNGAIYSVSVSAQPPGQTCTVVGGEGVISNSAITHLSVYCPPAGASISLLAGSNATGAIDGSNESSRFLRPENIAVDSAGNAFIADTANCTIRRVAANGGVTTLAGSPAQCGHRDGTGADARFDLPRGIAVDISGNVYVADQLSSTVRRISPDQTVITLAGSAYSNGLVNGAGAQARFGSPWGIAVDSSGNVYVADANNCAIRRITSVGVVSTLAGGSGCGFRDGTGGAAWFYFPLGVTVLPSGDVYVADSGNSVVRRVTPTGSVTTFAGYPQTVGSVDGVGTAARFNVPHSISSDVDGNLFVADTFSHTVRKITPARVVTTLAGTAGRSGSADGVGAAARFNYPSGIAVDSDGTAFVADTHSHSIRLIAVSAAVSTLAGPSESSGPADGFADSARFKAPEYLATDLSGNLFVADTYNHTIRRVTPTGLVTTFAGMAGEPGSSDGIGSSARFSLPRSIAVDGSGTVYVAESGNNKIRRITSAGVVTTLAGGGPSGSADGEGTNARFNSPRGIALAPSGDLVVADTGNHTIRRVTAAGVVTTLAGSPGQSEFRDGAGIAARFASPEGIVVDGAGSIFVTDSGNQVIRRITPTGETTTLAGLPRIRGSIDGKSSQARFELPGAMAIDASGTMYVVDARDSYLQGVGGCSVRRITSDAVVTTILGFGFALCDGTLGPLPASLSPVKGLAVLPDGNLVLSVEHGLLHTNSL
jgi:sugar lactone lactonase YvrE